MSLETISKDKIDIPFKLLLHCTIPVDCFANKIEIMNVISCPSYCHLQSVTGLCFCVYKSWVLFSLQ